MDKLRNESGISDWVRMDAPLEINEAVSLLLSWVTAHRNISDTLWEKCHVGISSYCGRKVMVVLEGEELFQGISEESLQACRDAQVSFCTILSDRKLYDLISRTEKVIVCEEYPNYHDETYADWDLR